MDARDSHPRDDSPGGERVASAEGTLDAAEGGPSRGTGGAPGLRRAFRSLRYRDYRLLWIGQLGSSGAMWMETIARNWLVWELTGSGLSLGFINLARALPGVALALPAGVVADRFDKKLVLQVAQVLTFASHALLSALVVTGEIRLWHLYFFSVTMGISMAFNLPARQSLIPRLVPAGELLNAVSQSQVAMNTTRVMGPALSGLLIGFSGIGAAYLASTGVFAVAIVTTVLLHTPEGERLGRRFSPTAQLVEGIVHVAHNKRVLAVMAVTLVAFTVVMPYATLLPIVADKVFDIGAEGYGFFLTLAGVGALLGGVSMASLGDLRRIGTLVLGGAIAFAGLILLLGLSRWLWLAVLVMPGVGVSQSVLMAAGNTVILAETPRELHGRVLAIYSLDWGLMPLGSLLAGGLADAFSAPITLVVMGTVGIALTAGVALAIPAVRRL